MTSVAPNNLMFRNRNLHQLLGYSSKKGVHCYFLSVFDKKQNRMGRFDSILIYVGLSVSKGPILLKIQRL